MIRLHRGAFCHATAFFISVFGGFLCSGMAAGFGLQAFFSSHYGKEPAPYLYPIVVFAAAVTAVLLIIYIFRRIPVSCPECRRRSFPARNSSQMLFVCSGCGNTFNPVTFQWPLHFVKTAKTIGLILLAPVLLLMLTILIGIGGPIVFMMFFGAYFILGPLLQIFVRLVPQKHAANQPTPWGHFFGIAFTMVLRTGAVIAFFRLMLALSGLKSTEPNNAMFNPVFDYFFGGCGILYALSSFSKEGFWHLQQVFAVRDLPHSKVASSAIGLTELSGVVRHIENLNGAIDPNRTVMSFYWQILGTEPGYGGQGVMLGTYRKDMHPFYLDDGTGKILVDPVQDGVELRRPFISVATTFIGRRSFEILLTRHIIKHSIIERSYELKEGDTVYIIGNVEVKEGAPAYALDSDRLVVRPRAQARKGLESLLQFLVPFGKKPTRTVHDIFVIADTDEKSAKGLLTKNLLFSVGMSLLLVLMSLVLILQAGARG